MLTAPAGLPHALTSSPSRRVVSGSCGGGFTVIVAPQAIAGAILCAASSTGKLNGVIPATGESGKRRVMAMRPVPAGTTSAGSTSPSMRVASSAPSRNTKMARSISVLACAIGLPASSASVRANSARAASSPSATLRKAAARAYAGISRQAGAAATFASSAARTSSGPASATTPTSLPSWGARMTAVSLSFCLCVVVISVGEQPPQPALRLGERFLEVLQVAAEAEPQEARHPEVIAGAEQHAVLRAQLLDDFGRGDRAAVARPADRAGVRRMPGERVAEPLEPRLHHGIVRVQDPARALDQLVAHVGIEGDGGEVIGRARRADRCVVVPRPRLLREAGLGDDPADAQTGEAVRFRQPVDDDHLVVARAPERFRRLAAQLRTLIDLIGQDPGADFRGAIENSLARRVAQYVAGRIVRIRDDDEFRPRRDGGTNLLDVGLPPFLFM